MTREPKACLNVRFSHDLGKPKSVVINFQKNRVRALVDTGAEVSLINYKVFQNLKQKPKIRPPPSSLHCANGGPLHIKGVTELNFKLGEEMFTHTFYVVTNLFRNCLLGNDFLEKEGAVINLQIMKLRINKAYVNLENDVHIATVVRSVKTVILRPNTATVLEVKAKSSPYFSEQEQFEIQPPDRGFVFDEPGLTVQPGLVTFGKRKFPLLLSNTTGKTIRLKRGCVMGKIESIKQAQVNGVTCVKNGTKPSIDPIKLEDLKVPDRYRRATIDLLKANEDINANSDLALTQTDTVKMSIKLTKSDPIKMRPYRAPLNKRKVIDQAIESMLDAKIIERSQSPYAFPVVVVDKKDGSKRFCVDFRELNKITKPIAYPLPLIDDILAQLGNSKFFSCLDLRAGYWQVKMADEDKEKTAFTCHRGLFHFNVLPFGLTNAPSVFSLLMQTVLAGLEDFAIPYLDDVIIFSQSEEEHRAHLQAVFDRLRQHHLKIKLKKCKFYQVETEYLGFIVSRDGIKPNPEKVEAIRQMSPPSNVKEVRSFIGLTSYYRRFIPNFSKIAEPILDLTKKYARFGWSPECQKAFEYIKDSLTVIPLLAYPDTSKPYTLYTDASDSCIGACLTQISDDGIEKPIYFLSHRLSKTQTRWSTIEREAYAIYFALNKLDMYLHNSNFVIKTDHKPLKYLFDSPIQNKKIALWALSLSGYNCTIEYIKGKENVLADMLSRLPADLEKDESENENVVDVNENTFCINAINSNGINPKDYATCRPTFQQDDLPNLANFDILTEQERDPKITSIKEELSSEKESNLKKRHMLVDQVLYFISHPLDDPVLRLYIPNHLRSEVLKQYHDELGHFGVDKTYQTMGRKFYWPNMFQQAYEYVNKCVTCQERVLKAKKAPLQNPDLPPYPFAKVHMDISGPYPRSLSNNRYILSIVCAYSGWPDAWCLPDKSAESIAHILIEEYFPKYSAPLQIVTDNALEFCSETLENTFKALNIDHITTSYYHPQSNSTVERYHRVLGDLLAKKLDRDLTTWDLHLNQCLAAIRFSVSEPRKHSPFFLVYNRDPVLPIDNILKPRQKYKGHEPYMIALENQHMSFMSVHKKLRKAQDKNKRLADRNRTLVELEIGDPVYLKNHQRGGKLDKKWNPYYRVVEKLSERTYKIRNQLDGKVTKSHIQDLRLAPIGDWDIPDFQDGVSRRQATYVINPAASSESSSESDSDQNDRYSGETDHSDHSDDQLQGIIRLKQHERVDSSSEDHVPLMEMQKRLRARRARKAREEVSNKLKIIEQRLACIEKGQKDQNLPSKEVCEISSQQVNPVRNSTAETENQEAADKSVTHKQDDVKKLFQQIANML